MSKVIESMIILIIVLVLAIISFTFNPISALIILVGLLYKYDDIKLLFDNKEVNKYG